MKVLFLNSSKSDYLADSFLIGLKRLPEYDVYEYPGNPYVYSDQLDSTIHGKGFTLYGLLDKSQKKVAPDLDFHAYDLIVFGNIHVEQYPLYLKYVRSKSQARSIFLDGSDDGYIFPYRGPWLRKTATWFMPKPHKHHPYFIREWIPEAVRHSLNLPWSKLGLNVKSTQGNFHTIHFGFPEEKIKTNLTEKEQLFASHVVDEEVAQNIGAKTSYVFDNEKEYYEDLAKSKFGITTKRAGWDCLRHYEIASQGTVLCFRDLDKKPKECAPHGLEANVNCISYQNYDHLRKQIERLSEKEYSNLQKNTLLWVKNQTCKKLVQETFRKAGIQSVN